ncbi:tRNA uridine-5-carboxymethylaminomethyl(34) synthesis GTPase MnmE [Sphingomonas sp. RB1R13]|uniref:tRNA uridine-5-carboxymethylaminomethyl(34) synthesis GTPase MnmE n=1 Tax=Sphingomonas sp. RB1R13 TaxID=3096159 RepID=UPI002FC84234
MRPGDTIVALSSGRPPAAVAIVRTSGPMAHSVGERLAGSLPEARFAALRILHDPRDGQPIDSALVIRFDAPHSSTGEDIVEYQCHGGRAVVAAVIDALTSCGLRHAEPGEFTRRSLGNGRIDLTEAEGLADLLEAETETQRRAALALASGGLSRVVEQWQGRVLALSAQAEAAIDYVGDEDETATDTARLIAQAHLLADELDAWLARPRAEPLKQGIRVVIAGPPNAGKSSLINSLSGSERAIVTDIAGTTRDTIEVPLAIDGMPFTLVDTAGLRDSDDLVERLGVERAHGETALADILLWLGHPDDCPPHSRAVLIRAKADLANSGEAPGLPVSAHTGAGMSALIITLRDTGAQLLPSDGSLPLNRRQAEAIAQASTFLRSDPADIVLLAETLRSARLAFDRLTGRAGVEDAIDALFTRFCLGK